MGESENTKRDFREAFEKLLAEKEFDAIRVSELCTLCGRNRKSFYYHFRDKYDLSVWIFESDMLALLTSLGEEAHDKDILLAVCRYFHEHRVYTRKLLAVEGQNSPREGYSSCIAAFLSTFLARTYGTRSDDRFLSTFYADALLAAIARWLSEKPPSPPGEMAEKLGGVARKLGIAEAGIRGDASLKRAEEL